QHELFVVINIFIKSVCERHFLDIWLGHSDQFNPVNEPLSRRMNNTTHEIGLVGRFTSVRFSPSPSLWPTRRLTYPNSGFSASTVLRFPLPGSRRSHR